MIQCTNNTVRPAKGIWTFTLTHRGNFINQSVKTKYNPIYLCMDNMKQQHSTVQLTKRQPTAVKHLFTNKKSTASIKVVFVFFCGSVTKTQVTPLSEGYK